MNQDSANAPQAYTAPQAPGPQVINLAAATSATRPARSTRSRTSPSSPSSCSALEAPSSLWMCRRSSRSSRAATACIPGLFSTTISSTTARMRRCGARRCRQLSSATGFPRCGGRIRAGCGSKDGTSHGRCPGLLLQAALTPGYGNQETVNLPAV